MVLARNYVTLLFVMCIYSVTKYFGKQLLVKTRTKISEWMVNILVLICL